MIGDFSDLQPEKNWELLLSTYKLKNEELLIFSKNM